MADYTSEERKAALAAVNGIVALRNAHARDLRDDTANAVPFTHELLLVTDWLRRVAGLPVSGVNRG